MLEQELLNLFYQGHFIECEQLARELIANQPENGLAWKVLGVLLKQQERYILALEAMRTATELLPNDAEAHGNLAVLLMNQGLLNDAVDCYQTALALNPQLIDAHYLLGLTLNSLGRTAEAQTCFQHVLELNADYTNAYLHLGAIYQQQGRLEDAEVCYRCVLQTYPEVSDVHYNLAFVSHWQGKSEAAEQHYRLAIALNPENAQAHGQLGLLLQTQARFSEAKQAYEVAIHFQPEFAELYNNLGIVCHELGLVEQAQSAYQQAIQIKSDFFEAYNNLGLNLQNQGRFLDAENAYRQAIQINPKHLETHHNLGMVFQTSGKFIEAKACYQRALMIQPDHAQVQYHLATLYQALGQLTQAEQHLIQVLQLNPYHSEARSRLLWLMNHRGASLEDCLQQALLYGKSVAVKTPYSRWQCEIQPERLRIGMVMGDLNYRAVDRFFTALFPELDQSCLELHIYSIIEHDAELSSQLKPYCASWQNIKPFNDQQVAQQIHNQGIHILFDLVGHAPQNRLALFAWQAAPVQVSWLGTLMTTGLTTMTYLLGDRDVTPTEHSQYFSETLWQMPECYRCFVEPSVYLDTEELPALTTGRFTFGCFQPLYCLNQNTIKLWATVLHAVPNSQLYLKNTQLNDIHHCQTLREQFADLGILPERLILEGSTTLVERLSAYRYVDIALDTFPETGFGSVEAIWMGVPVLTRIAHSFISRSGAGIAHNIDLTDWIAVDEEDYIAKAVYFSGNLDYLNLLREQLRERLLESPLFSIEEFARNFEAMLWSMYNP